MKQKIKNWHSRKFPITTDDVVFTEMVTASKNVRNFMEYYIAGGDDFKFIGECGFKGLMFSCLVPDDEYCKYELVILFGRLKRRLV